MCDFEKKFRSCGKVTSLSLTVNAISAKILLYRRFFNPDVSQTNYAAFFRPQTLPPIPNNPLNCDWNVLPNLKYQPEGSPLLLITGY